MPDTKHGPSQGDSYNPNDHKLFDLPFKNLSFEDLNERIVKFYEHLNINIDPDLLKRGAYLAQRRENLHDEDPQRSEPQGGQQKISHRLKDSLPLEERIITEQEDRAVNLEKSGAFKSLTKSSIIILVTCALGAIAQGWTQESIVGANLQWPIALHIAKNSTDGTALWHAFDGSKSQNNLHPDKGLELFSLVNAITYFAACVVGAWVTDPLTYVKGRRFALLCAGVCTLAGPIGASYCNTWVQLFFCRFIQGVGVGAKSSVVPVIESEVFQPEIRGRLLVSWQTFVAVGIFLGTSSNLIFHDSWRHQIGIAFIPAVPLLCLCYVIPESPRWLMKKGRYGEAYKVLLELRETPLQAARDLFLIHEQIDYERSPAVLKDGRGRLTISKQDSDSTVITLQQGAHNFFERVPLLFFIRRNFRAVVASSVVMIAQQFSGINIFSFLATTILQESGIPDSRNSWFNFGFAGVNAIASGLTYFLIDRFGRRTLLLTSLALMFPFLLACGFAMDANGNGPPHLGAVIPLVLIFVAIYSPGAGVVPFMYAAEVFPQDFREVGMSWACSVNFAFAGGLAMAVPQFTSSGTHKYRKLLGAFAGLDALAAILVWLFMRGPERADSLGDMNLERVVEI
ncbi:hypothetical protein EG328_001499 [Venturia inaequalis]|uniref:Major facilitator superfamily (MFS) profile domain-containing protein n=1 Tax=Venturia inaequalis TaxID=5025 RepID=A0A8H3YY27_VENIN|nr:hypothetical protein EG328_001499 [Venturia inaequalis]